jgi:hypothetical protein
MSNLLNKASIILTPTAYSSGDLHCIKPNTATGDFDFTRSTTATRINSSGNVESVAANLPRIDYTGGTGQILLEPQSTNKLTHSEDFNSSAWLLSDLTATANQINSPDGTLNASKLEMTGSGSLRSQSEMTFSDAYSYSIFVKKGNSRYVTLRSAFFTQSIVVGFDLDSETAQTDGKIENYGNDWYRLSISKDISSDADKSGFFYMYLPNSLGGQTSVSGNFAYYYGAQIEDSTFPTSYIPTSGSTVTRNEELATNSGSSSLISGGGSGEGVIYAEIAGFSSLPGVGNISLSDNNTLRRIVIGFGFSANQILCTINNGSTFPNFLSFQTVTDVTAYNKIALKYKLNDISLFINGVEVATDTSSTIPTLQTLQFNNGHNGRNQFFGKVKCVAIYKEALTDLELTCLTT